MIESITGKAYVVGDSIDTDQIIPAEHLVYSMMKPEERRKYGRFALSGVPAHLQGLPFGNIPFTPPDGFTSEFKVVVAGNNFGCGSSREHAPFAIREAGCTVVVAESFARIFYRNAVDGGFLLPFEAPVGFSKEIRTGDELHIDVGAATLENRTTGQMVALRPLGAVKAIVEAGNVFEYARQAGLIAATRGGGPPPEGAAKPG